MTVSLLKQQRSAFGWIIVVLQLSVHVRCATLWFLRAKERHCLQEVPYLLRDWTMFDSIQDDSCGSKDSEFLETAIKIFRFKLRSEKEAQTLQRPRDLLKSARACFFCIPFNIDLFLLFFQWLGLVVRAVITLPVSLVSFLIHPPSPMVISTFYPPTTSPLPVILTLNMDVMVS